MPSPRLLDGESNPDESKRDAVCDSIRKQLFLSLGKPTNLLTVQVRPVGGQNYRVNVVVGTDFSSTRIANSYFLKADAEGNILTSSPEIVSLY